MTIPFAIAGLGLTFGAISEKYALLYVPNYRDIITLTTGTDMDIERNAFRRAKQILVAEEGRRSIAYLDSLGNLTVGIGHKVLPGDNIKLGQAISEQRIDELFEKDMNKAFSAAISQAKEIDKYNADMVARLASVNFQLGTGWRTKFPNTWSLIKSGNIAQAIQNLINSNWYRQTPTRVASFITTLRNNFA